MINHLSALALAFLTVTSAASVFDAKQSQSTPQSAYVNKLLNGATPLRKLDGEEAEEQNVDISSYYIRFEKCQFVKAFSDDLAQEGEDTVLATERFVIFRLCPNSDSCSGNYGEYMVDMDEYLQYTVEYRQQEQEEMCEMCDDMCEYYGYGDDGGEDAGDEDEESNEEEEEGDEDEEDRRRRLARQKFSGRKLDDMTCNECVSACEKIENMEENFYVDATYFVNCQELVEENDEQTGLWAGPMCSSQGSKIKIGVFTDEDCMFLDANKDVEDYLADENGYALKLSHALLKTTYDNNDLISCLQQDENQDQDYYQNAEAETKEVCENLYQAAAKCEEVHGFDNGINKYYNNYANQDNNEELVCSFIDSLLSGTYSQDGEIVIGGTTSYKGTGGTSTTGGQKFALTFFILGTIGLAVYAAMLHAQLTKGGKPDLSTQGGAMA